MNHLEYRELRITAIVLISVFYLSIILVGSVTAETKEMLVTTSISLERREADEILSISISGRVMGTLNQSISGADVSIQVEDPFGSTVHIALVYSRIDGSYLDQFLLKGDISPGNYSIYLTANKIGYEDTYVEIPFLIVIYDFSISAIPDIQIIRQGDMASYEIILIRSGDQRFPITLTAAGLPGNTSYLFIDGYETLETKSYFLLNTSKETPTGTYNITLIGQGGGKIYSLSIALQVIEEIEEVEEPPQTVVENEGDRSLLLIIFSLISILVAFLLFFYLWKVGKISFERMRVRAEPRQDKEYLAAARALAELEELRASNEIDEKTYIKLRKEYKDRLKK